MVSAICWRDRSPIDGDSPAQGAYQESGPPTQQHERQRHLRVTSAPRSRAAARPPASRRGGVQALNGDGGTERLNAAGQAQQHARSIDTRPVTAAP